MWEDPIVAEVHRTRAELAAAFNFDVKAIFADLRKRQAALGPRLVSPKKQPNKAVQPTGAADSVLQTPSSSSGRGC
jgi:hypothetical protein